MFRKVEICGVLVDRCSFDEATKVIIEYASLLSHDPQYVVTPNAQHVVLLQSDICFRDAYQNAWLTVADGVPLVWAAKLLGTPLKGRVNGTDLLVKLCEIAASRQLRVFFLGGRPGAAERATQLLKVQNDKLDVAGIYCPPYGFENNEQEQVLISEMIISTSPHILFVGFGTPKQEVWIYKNYRVLKVPISIGIGGSFDLVAGMVRRAPKWMQQIGLEWFFRLLIEPGRLWKRYIVGNPLFLWCVLKQRLGRLYSDD